jgi:hypothetical protein
MGKFLLNGGRRMIIDDPDDATIASIWLPLARGNLCAKDWGRSCARQTLRRRDGLRETASVLGR